MIHTNELPLCHLIICLDGPTSSDTGFTGPVCRLLGKVNTMSYDPGFKALPGGEDLIKIPQSVLVKMSTGQQLSYKLVQAVKSGSSTRATGGSVWQDLSCQMADNWSEVGLHVDSKSWID